MIYRDITRAQLKDKKASDYQEGDILVIEDRYIIRIVYGSYKTPRMKTTVETIFGKLLTCTRGIRGGWPYYIADFIGR